MLLKQGLEQKQTQRLSPIQIQTIKLIETPFQELEQAVRNEWESNPVLEEERVSSSEEDKEAEEAQPKDISIDDIKDDDSIPSYKLVARNWGKDERPEYNTFSVKESFNQSLEEQLGFKNLSRHEHDIALFLIGSLDEDGYLRRDISSIVDDLAFRANIETDEDEVEKMLKVIQEFEPSGVGARDLRECLLIQLKILKPCEEVENAEKILSQYYNEFVNKHFQKIMSRMGLSADKLKAALGKILKLNPSPGGQVDDTYNDRAQQIVPDFVLDVEDDGTFRMEMPRFPLPEVRVKKEYKDILNEAKISTDPAIKESATFVKQKVAAAQWYVEALRQRHDTLESTMNAILDFQHEFFTDGDETKLKPMVLKDIADITGYDISTVSRVVSSKYIETHFGVYPLKYFFSEGLESQSGEEVSSREIKKALREAVDAEDKSRPLTDDQLVEVLTAKGYNIARRTIAKYRDQLQIPMARLRKEL